MKIGILEAGAPPGPLAKRFGSYGNMFRRLLGPAFKFEPFDVQAGALPPADDDCEAYLITGSSSGVYDDEPWIAQLEQFIRERVGEKPLIGVCFGHQLMAQALGGQGVHRYELSAKASWMDGGGAIGLPVSHQDQVVALGPEGRVIGGNDFTPFGLVDYPNLRAMSVQAHPEFEVDFVGALIDARGGSMGDEATEAAIESLKIPTDRRRVAVWMRRFFNTV